MEEATLSVGAGYVYTMNIVVGAGFLGFPYGFQQTGILLSLFYLFIVALLNNYLTFMFLEVNHKVKLFQDWQREGYDLKFNIRDIISSKSIEYPSTDLQEQRENRRIDATTTMSVIFGKKFGIFYLFMLTLSFIGGMMAYASIFASSLSSNVPLGSLGSCDIYDVNNHSECMIHYYIYLSAYSVIVVFLTVKGLKEQKIFQIIMCGMRFIIMGLIVICSLDSIVRRSSIDNTPYESPSPPLMNARKTDVALPIIIFALMYQLQFPSVAAIVKDKEQNLWKIVMLVAFTSCFWYGALGVTVPYAVKDIEAEVSLNFREYTAGKSSQNYWTGTVSFIIVLFPALDVVSSYPFASIPLADNWRTMIYGETQIPRRKDIAIKLFVSIIPLFLAFFLYDIGIILDFIGLTPLFCFHCMVPIAHILVRTLCDVKSVYDIKVYWRSLNIIISMLSITLLVYLFIQLISRLQ